jgi:hypothetical protein
MLRRLRRTLISSATLPMNVLALTILVSSCLAGIFIACFAVEIRRARRTSPERDSLLPLDPEPPAQNPLPTHHP